MHRSTILNYKEATRLINLCEFAANQEFKLLYRASQNGFAAADFHKRCDGIKNTLIIIKSNNGYIFGGYTSAAWSSNNRFVKDTDSFIFSLLNSEKSPFKAKCSNSEYAVCGSPFYGPMFGKTDLRISSLSNKNNNSISYFGRVFTNDLSKNILAGGFNFQTKEIEVYEIN